MPQRGRRCQATRTLAYADAFAVATALALSGVIVTGDPEFTAVADLVPVEWLPQGPE